MTTRTRVAAAGLVAGALLLAGCGSDDTSSSDTTAPATTAPATTTTVAAELQITDAWARQSPMGTTAGAVYLTITSPIDDALVGASVPTSVAGTTEVHETVAAGEPGMTTTTGGDMAATTAATSDATTTTMGGGSDSMTMRPVDSIALPAGEAVALEPGGFHIMLLDLVAPLEVGQRIEVTLTFAEAGEQTVTADVRAG